MSSIGMDWSRYLKSEKLGVYPLQPPLKGKDSGDLLAELALDLEWAQRKFDVVVLDAITNVASSSQESAVIGFLTTCKKLTNMGMTIILVTHSVAFNADQLSCASSMCDTHLNLRTGKIRDKVVRVVKLDDVAIDRDNEVSFGVDPGNGISIVLFSSSKA